MEIRIVLMIASIALSLTALIGVFKRSKESTYKVRAEEVAAWRRYAEKVSDQNRLLKEMYADLAIRCFNDVGIREEMNRLVTETKKPDLEAGEWKSKNGKILH